MEVENTYDPVSGSRQSSAEGQKLICLVTSSECDRLGQGDGRRDMYEARETLSTTHLRALLPFDRQQSLTSRPAYAIRRCPIPQLFDRFTY